MLEYLHDLKLLFMDLEQLIQDSLLLWEKQKIALLEKARLWDAQYRIDLAELLQKENALVDHLFTKYLAKTWETWFVNIKGFISTFTMKMVREKEKTEEEEVTLSLDSDLWMKK
jgi:hypothetical protein